MVRLFSKPSQSTRLIDEVADIAYIHMDLNVDVGLASPPPVHLTYRLGHRSTTPASSFHGTGITSSSSRTFSSKSVATMEFNPIGTGPWVSYPFMSIQLLELISVIHADHHDLYNATIWDDSPSGLGRWGDPANDFQINSGGFKDQMRSYPSPHHIRRNLTLFPFRDPVFGQSAGPLANYMPNTTMTRENVASMVDGFDGDFIGFHAYFESPSVSCIPRSGWGTPTHLFDCKPGTPWRSTFDGVGVGIYHCALSLNIRY